MQIGYPRGGGGILIFLYNTCICIIIFIIFFIIIIIFFFLGGGGGGSENLIFMEKADFVDTFFWHISMFFLSSRYRTGIHFVGI